MKNDITGRIFGSLTVTSFSHMGLNSNDYWDCICVCGKENKVRRQHLLTGNIKSCGIGACSSSFKHGMKNTREYEAWIRMKGRCNNPKNPRYKDWGGRGIKVCDEWNNSFDNFYKDMGVRPSNNHSLGRIKNNGNYEPSNCRWETVSQQSINKRVYSKSKTGISGVRFANGKYISDIRLNKKLNFLGCFNDFFEACCARKSFEAKNI